MLSIFFEEVLIHIQTLITMKTIVINLRSLTATLITSTMLAAFTAPAVPVVLQNATADFSQLYWDGPFYVSQSIDGITYDERGWAIAKESTPVVDGTPRTAVYETQSDVGFAGGSLLTFTLYFNHTSPFAQHSLGHFRLSLTTDNRNAFADGLQNGGDVTANWLILRPLTLSSANGATMTRLADNSILVSGFNPATDVYTITADTTATGITGFRLEALPDSSLVNNGPGRANNGNFVLTEFQVAIVPEPSAAAITSVGITLAVIFRVRNRR